MLADFINSIGVWLFPLKEVCYCSEAKDHKQGLVVMDCLGNMETIKFRKGETKK
jgi:hypothetical protein